MSGQLDRLRRELVSAEKKLAYLRSRRPHYNGSYAEDVDRLKRALEREELKAAGAWERPAEAAD